MKVAQGLVEFLIEMCPEAAMSAGQGGNLSPHLVCSKAAKHWVLQLLLDACNGDVQDQRGLSTSNASGWLPAHCLLGSRYLATEALQHFIEMHPEALMTGDQGGVLPLHTSCTRGYLLLDHACLMVNAAPFSFVQKRRDGRVLCQLACDNFLNRNVEVETRLACKESEAMAALKEASDHVAATYLGLPDLIAALVCKCAKPDLWMP